MSYPPGDVRNDLMWRLGTYGLAILVLVGAIVYSIRWLRADRRRPKGPDQGRRDPDSP